MQYRFKDLIVDLDSGTVSRDGVDLGVSGLSWRVFASLIKRAPDIVTNDALAADAWRQAHVTSETIAQRIKLLRKALGDDPAAPTYIVTERGLGYRLAAKPEAEPKPAPKTHRAPGKSVIPTISLPALAITIAALAGLALVFTAFPRQQAPAGDNFGPLISGAELVQQGRVYLSRGSFNDNENALRLFQQALEQNPSNVDAKIGLSLALSHRSTKYDFATETAQEAEKLALEAVEAEPLNALGWEALGFAKDAQAEISEALKAYEQSIAIDATNVGSLSSAAYLLQIQGRLHEALLREQQALDLGDPSLFTYLQVASVLHLAGLDKSAAAWLDRAQTLTPDNLLLKDTQAALLLAAGEFEEALTLSTPAGEGDRRAALDIVHGEALFALGKPEEARAAFLRAREQDDNGFTGSFELAALDIVEGVDGAPENARALLETLREARAQGDEWPQMSVVAAYLLASSNQGAEALALLRDAFVRGYRDPGRLRHSPFLANIHGTPAFEALLTEIEAETARQRTLILNDPRLKRFHQTRTALPKGAKRP